MRNHPEVGVEINLGKPVEACGVFGVFTTDNSIDIARLAYDAAITQQHRGRQAAGAAVSDGMSFKRIAEPGLVNSVFRSGERLKELGDGILALSQVRYGTIPKHSGIDPMGASQPISRAEGLVQVAHNGNWIPGKSNSVRMSDIPKTDTEIFADMLEEEFEGFGGNMEMALGRLLPKVYDGAFSLVIATPEQMFAIRDPYGFRPLHLGKLPGGHVIASETSVFDVYDNIQDLGEVRPGEMLTIDNKGFRSSWPFSQLGSIPKSLCSYELGYFSKPASRELGMQNYEYRANLGRQLAIQDREKYPDLEIDVIVGVPDSGIPAAVGYAEESGIPYQTGFMKIPELGRTFLEASDEAREQAAARKYLIYDQVFRDKRVLMVDDSVIRAHTGKRLIALANQARPRELHLRSSMPQYTNPCFMGLDTSDKDELIAVQLDGDLTRISEEINATTTDFNTIAAMLKAFGTDEVCKACMDGDYPISIK